LSNRIWGFVFAIAIVILLGSCRSIVSPVEATRSARRESVRIQEPLPQEPSTHSRPKKIEANEIMNRITVDAPPGIQFQALDPVHVHSHESDDDFSESWSASTQVAYRQVTLGYGTLNWSASHRSDIESDGGAIVARVRGKRADIWFEKNYGGDVIEVRIGDHEFEVARSTVIRSPIPLSECVWITVGGPNLVVPCALGDDPEDPDLVIPGRRRYRDID